MSYIVLYNSAPVGALCCIIDYILFSQRFFENGFVSLEKCGNPGKVNIQYVSWKSSMNYSFRRNVYAIHSCRMFTALSVQFKCLYELLTWFGFYIPFNSLGHIRTGPQHYHLWGSNPHRGDYLRLVAKPTNDWAAEDLCKYLKKIYR